MNFVEIDIESFINTNAILLTMVVLVVSMVFTSLTVWLVNVSHKLARKPNPNALIRLLIYIFVEFIAFMFDAVFVAFVSYYRLPWVSLLWLGGIIVYNLFIMMNLLSNFGFSIGSFMKNVVALSKTAKDVDAGYMIDRLEEFQKEEEEIMKKSKKRSNVINDSMIILIVITVTMGSCVGLRNPFNRSNLQPIQETLIDNTGVKVESTKERIFVSSFTPETLVRNADLKRKAAKSKPKAVPAQKDGLSKEEKLVAVNHHSLEEVTQRSRIEEKEAHESTVEEPKVVVVMLRDKPLFKITFKEKK